MNNGLPVSKIPNKIIIKNNGIKTLSPSSENIISSSLKLNLIWPFGKEIFLICNHQNVFYILLQELSKLTLKKLALLLGYRLGPSIDLEIDSCEI